MKIKTIKDRISLADPIVTPVLEALWPNVMHPKAWKDAEPGDKGSYSVRLILNPNVPEHAAFLEKCEQVSETLESAILESLGKKAIKKKANFIPVVDEEGEDGLPTGRKILRATRKAGGISKATKREWSYTLPVVTVSRAPFRSENDQELGSGSKLRASFYAEVYQIGSEYGVRFSLDAVQVVEAEYYNSSAGAGVFADEKFGEVSDDAVDAASNF